MFVGFFGQNILVIGRRKAVGEAWEPCPCLWVSFASLLCEQDCSVHQGKCTDATQSHEQFAHLTHSNSESKFVTHLHSNHSLREVAQSREYIPLHS